MRPIWFARNGNACSFFSTVSNYKISRSHMQKLMLITDNIAGCTGSNCCLGQCGLFAASEVQQLLQVSLDEHCLKHWGTFLAILIHFKEILLSRKAQESVSNLKNR